MLGVLAKDRRLLRRGMRPFAFDRHVGEACVFVDHGFLWDGSSNVWLTRARASYVLGVGPSFAMRPRHAMARALGPSGSPSDERSIDQYFTMRSQLPEEARAALTSRVKALLVGEFEDACLESDGKHITLYRESDFGREVDADVAIELVSEIAHCHSEILHKWRKLPNAKSIAATGSWDERTPCRVEIPQKRLYLQTASDQGRAVTELLLSVPGPRTRFCLTLNQEPLVDLPQGISSSKLHEAVNLGLRSIDFSRCGISARFSDLEARADILLHTSMWMESLASSALGSVYR